ncbi:MAG: carboxypeptidase-like regulatory domain-containing protein [ANME-2 cluster archaeon]|nr:carboxypeptidase-like regulatory domain-containing protein [ANME-2 cluster archaeon]
MSLITNMLRTILLFICQSQADNNFQKPSITTPVLSSRNVTTGKHVSITATVSLGATYAFVDGAQYRITNASGELVPWTPMYSIDGNFDGTSEVISITINSSNMLGTYTIQVRGMAGGKAQSDTARYYPMNGDVSVPLSTILTVEPPRGYINGTITSSGLPVAGATVSTTGVSSITDSNGNYSLKLFEGTYNVSASKLPEYYDNSVIGVEVMVYNTTIKNIVLNAKPKGLVHGRVMMGAA